MKSTYVKSEYIPKPKRLKPNYNTAKRAIKLHSSANKTYSTLNASDEKHYASRPELERPKKHDYIGSNAQSAHKAVKTRSQYVLKNKTTKIEPKYVLKNKTTKLK